MKQIGAQFRMNLLLVAFSAVMFYCSILIQGMWHQACVERVLKDAPAGAFVSLHVPPFPQVLALALVFVVTMVINRKSSRWVMWCASSGVVAAGVAIDFVLMMAAYAWWDN